MGNLIWHEYARLVTITASIYTIWAGFFAIYFRKFFWDFVGGTVRDPGGIQPAPQAAFFIAVIVKAPVVPIISMLLGMFIVALEFPGPQLKGMAIQRSFIFKTVMLIIQAFFAVLFYQGTNGALWSLIAAMCYTRAIMLGETMAEAKENRGKAGEA
ncbi:hypothetical protein JAAARDRAFT_270990 [Jaapia argillacea MUCL 33604]|uniref:DUF7727 domain-containing protein n=1 Tax=Jaapia argillacea MUCL 33604 TaxID=933084 RepID=A0A067PUV4_9AGAM|nr:hypothetical protein JAAARDRAFT_270990 [Jaapia argillacea MUCL 33604]